MSDYKLLPCPDCGGKTRCVSMPYTHDKYMVVCFTDWCENYAEKWYDTKEEAIKAWNTRAQLSRQKGD